MLFMTRRNEVIQAKSTPVAMLINYSIVFPSVICQNSKEPMPTLIGFGLYGTLSFVYSIMTENKSTRKLLREWKRVVDDDGLDGIE